jgi:O-antigen ligase
MNIINRYKMSSFVFFLIFGLIATLGMISGGAWAGITIGGAVLLAISVGLEEGRFGVPDKNISLFVGAFLVIGTLSALISPFPEVAFHTNLKLGGVFVPLLLLTVPAVQKAGVRFVSENQTVLGYLMLLGLVVLFGFMVFVGQTEGVESMSMSKTNRAVSYALLLSLPFLALAVRQRSLAAWGILFLMAVVLVFTRSATTQVALLGGGGTFLVARYWPSLVGRLIGAGMLASLGWPFFARYLIDSYQGVLSKLPPTLAARVEIWDYMSYRLSESPLLGYGLGVSHKLGWVEPNGYLYQFTVSQASHPHNAVIQSWVELGVVGPVLGGVACFWLLRKVQRLDSWLKPYVWAALACAYILLMAAYSLWTDSLWGALALTGLTFNLVQKTGIKPSLRSRPHYGESKKA